MATRRSSPDQQNFFRMTVLIVDNALKVLQDVLQKELRTEYPSLFDPSTGLLCGVLGDGTVRKKLDRLVRSRVLNVHQQNQLYPGGNPSSSVTVGDLDITLTVLLLRNITTLNPRPPLNAWDDPSDTDTSREATIGRVKRYRNIVYGHANKAAISDQDFRVHFSGLKSNLLALSSMYNDEDYDAILSKPLDAALLERNQNILKEWCDYDKDVKDQLMNMQSTMEEIPEQIINVLKGSVDTILKKMDSDSQNTQNQLEEISQGITQIDIGQSEMANQLRQSQKCMEEVKDAQKQDSQNIQAQLEKGAEELASLRSTLGQQFQITNEMQENVQTICDRDRDTPEFQKIPGSVDVTVHMRISPSGMEAVKSSAIFSSSQKTPSLEDTQPDREALAQVTSDGSDTDQITGISPHLDEENKVINEKGNLKNPEETPSASYVAVPLCEAKDRTFLEISRKLISQTFTLDDSERAVKLMERYHAMLYDTKRQCFILRLVCPSVHSLDQLWQSYGRGELQAAVEESFVSIKTLEDLGLSRSDINLWVKMDEDDYNECRKYIKEKTELKAMIYEDLKMTVRKGPYGSAESTIYGIRQALMAAFSLRKEDILIKWWDYGSPGDCAVICYGIQAHHVGHIEDNIQNLPKDVLRDLGVLTITIGTNTLTVKAGRYVLVEVTETMATARSSPDQQNFFRMSVLTVDYALKVLQDVLQKEIRTEYPSLFDPSTGLLCQVLGDGTVRKKLDRLVRSRVLNVHQQNQLYPGGNPSPSVTVDDLDITLTVLLLRNITALNPRPGLKAWDDPSDADTSREAMIGRVKRYRNIVYGHANKAAISDQEFRAHFSGLKSNLLALSSTYTNEDYDAILLKHLDAALLERNQCILKEWYNYDIDVKDYFMSMQATLEESHEQIIHGLKESEVKLLDHVEQVHKTSEDTILSKMDSDTRNTHNQLEEINQKLTELTDHFRRSHKCKEEVKDAQKQDSQNIQAQLEKGRGELASFRSTHGQQLQMTKAQAAFSGSEPVVEVPGEVTERDEGISRLTSVPLEHHVQDSVPTEQEFCLRKYQRELANEAIKGTNTIICAPTGSGKTLTVAYICRIRRIQLLKNGQKFKAVFIVCIRNLIQQQKDAFQTIFPPQDNIVGAVSQTSDNLKTCLLDNDIVMLTAQILVNAIKEGDVKITDLNLMIMDECHHTDLDHPYNAIMRLYMMEKKNRDQIGESTECLPQIIGLSASLGTGKGNDPLQHYYRVCANLDCFTISHVRNPVNEKELLCINPKPETDQIKLVPPRSSTDPFTFMVKQMMEESESEVNFPMGTSKNFDKGSQGYENWVIENRNEAERQALHTHEMRNTVITCRFLRDLNSALMLYDDFRGKDALEFLTKKILNDDHSIHSELPEVEKKLRTRFLNQYGRLQSHCEKESSTSNKMLEELYRLLTEQFEKKNRI